MFARRQNLYSPNGSIGEQVKYNKFRASAFDVSKETDPEIIALYYKGIEDVKRRKAEAAGEVEEARKIKELSQKIREENIQPSVLAANMVSLS